MAKIVKPGGKGKMPIRKKLKGSLSFGKIGLDQAISLPLADALKGNIIRSISAEVAKLGGRAGTMNWDWEQEWEQTWEQDWEQVWEQSV